MPHFPAIISWLTVWIQYLNVWIWIPTLLLIRHVILYTAMAPHSSTLAWKIPWMEELGGLQSMGSQESDMTERLHFHFSLSCIAEGNGNSLQCSCLENPRDGESGGLLSMGSHRVGHDWSDLAAAAIYFLVLPFPQLHNMKNLSTILRRLSWGWNWLIFGKHCALAPGIW